MITITISVENTLETNGMYVIPRSNFSNAFILGVPLKLVSRPYMKMEKSFGCNEQRVYVQAVSLITGIRYEIPYDLDWLDIYETYEEMVCHCAGWISKGYKVYQDKGRIEQIIGKEYFPADNSYSSDFKGRHCSLVGKSCKVLSVPFDIDTEFGKRSCILVKQEKKVCRCYFTEWALR